MLQVFNLGRQVIRTSLEGLIFVESDLVDRTDLGKLTLEALKLACIGLAVLGLGKLKRLFEHDARLRGDGLHRLVHLNLQAALLHTDVGQGRRGAGARLLGLGHGRLGSVDRLLDLRRVGLGKAGSVVERDAHGAGRFQERRDLGTQGLDALRGHLEGAQGCTGLRDALRQLGAFALEPIVAALQGVRALLHAGKLKLHAVGVLMRQTFRTARVIERLLELDAQRLGVLEHLDEQVETLLLTGKLSEGLLGLLASLLALLVHALELGFACRTRLFKARNLGGAGTLFASKASHLGGGACLGITRLRKLGLRRLLSRTRRGKVLAQTRQALLKLRKHTAALKQALQV